MQRAQGGSEEGTRSRLQMPRWCSLLQVPGGPRPAEPWTCGVCGEVQLSGRAGTGLIGGEGGRGRHPNPMPANAPCGQASSNGGRNLQSRARVNHWDTPTRGWIRKMC